MKIPCIRIFTATLLMLGCVLAATAQKPRLVLPHTPEFAGLCIDANLYIVRQGHEIVAYDMDSGEARWRYDDWPTGIYPQSAQGQHNLILAGVNNAETKFVVLRTENGEVLWEYTERSRDSCTRIEDIPDSDWFQVRYAVKAEREGQEEEYYTMLVSPDGKRKYRAPQDMWLQGWRQKDKTLELTARGNGAFRLVFWDPETDTLRDVCAHPAGHYVGRLHNETLLLERYDRHPEPHYWIEILDGDTGHLLRKVALPGHIDGSTRVVMNGKAFLLSGEEGDRVWLLDPDTDAVLADLQQPGHKFILSSAREDASGRVWIVSLDAEERGYLGRVSPEGL